MNVKVKASGLDDKDFVEDIISKGREIETRAMIEEEKIINIVEAAINHSTGKKTSLTEDPPDLS